MKDQILDKFIKFNRLLGFVALGLAGVSAFFSVWGVATLFGGASIAATIMMSALEIAKLVTVTFLYRYWNVSTKLIRAYLVIAVLVLMTITSGGIFGFLSSAYQKSSLEFKATQEQIVSLEQGKSNIFNQISKSDIRIKTLNEARTLQENRLSEALKDQFLTRNPLQLKQLQEQTISLIKQSDDNIKSETQKIEEYNTNIKELDSKVGTLKYGENSKKDIQTLKFLADALNVSLDTLTRWFILLLIVVFDPLAVCLVLAYNVSVGNNYSTKKDIISNITPILPSTASNVPLDTISSNKQESSSNIDNLPVNSNVTVAPEVNDSYFKSYFKL